MNTTHSQLSENTLLMTADQLRQTLSQTSSEQLQALVSSINDQHDAQWKEKLLATFNALTTPNQLETVAGALTPVQARYLLEKTPEWGITKLPPLMAGLPPAVFPEILLEATPQILQSLKQIAVTEPLQHQLTVLQHEMTLFTEKLTATLMLKEQERFNLIPSEMGLKERSLTENQLSDLVAASLYLLKILDQALAVAWNSERTDLIESLSSLKEHCLKTLQPAIGQPRTEESAPTGLYALLEESFNRVYSDPNNPSDPQSLRDDDPVMEALAKFSIWYLEDYFDIGLISSVRDKSSLELNPEQFSEGKCIEHRRKLFLEAQDKLATKGLVTVRDLKAHRIFSKKSLLDYLGGVSPI
ncbi:MAG: hypothetical protein H0X51_06335 [Parachlamydiaceae bacterium]|nr:hypothetical protein [Parachlamydiaceae bacterium]